MDVDFKAESDILIVTLAGYVSNRDALQARADATRYQKQGGVRGYLVDVRQAQINMTTMDLFNFFASLNDVFALGTKHAVLYSRETNDIFDVTFGENVSVNRGVLLKMFTEVDEAWCWLSGTKYPAGLPREHGRCPSLKP